MNDYADQVRLKLLIVDDEPMARRRIRSFALERHGFEIVGEAENGNQAWNKIRELAPDIVVADIGMPVLNGLELLKRVHGMNTPPKFILLTCYEDFDKIQAALRYGAHDYITKLLLSERDFIACLNKAALTIRQERRNRKQALRQLLLERLLSNDDADASADQLAALSFPSRRHMLALIRFAPEHNRAMFGASPALENAEEDRVSLAVQIEPGLWAMIAATDERGGGQAFFGWTMQTLRRGYEACRINGIAALQSVSDIRSGPPLTASLIQCRQLMDEAYYLPLGVPAVAGTPGRSSTFPPDVFEAMKQECRQAVERGDPEAVAQLLLRWLEEAERHYLPKPAQLCMMGAALAGGLSDDYTCRQTDGFVPLRLRLQKRIEESCHISEVRAAVEEAADALRETQTSLRSVRSEVLKALRFVEQRYREPIDAAAAAGHVNLSPSWFGTLFRNEIGCSFSDYLLTYRLEQARELLLRTDLKVYEIAEQTGIPNYRYFSKLFSGKYGLKPQDFRCRLRGGEREYDK
ncbi:response regulator [Cohnella cellulosilytica]|uniref:Response regulator n=1 Tax=Cohnella cellulosilytica TaxID=986710 RepID=A0ABW2F4U3_9BACL